MRKLEEMERLRKEEEDALEARRKVLCSNDSAADSSGEQQVVAEESPPESWTVGQALLLWIRLPHLVCNVPLSCGVVFCLVVLALPLP